LNEERGRVLIHVLDHPEVGAIIGAWQENCPDLSGAVSTVSTRREAGLRASPHDDGETRNPAGCH
jgi:hypothetical protein